MYQEALLAHHRAPHNKREMPDATGMAEHKNPVCGDHIRVMVRVENDRIAEVSFLGQSCSVGTAAASLMTDAVTGLSLDDAHRIVALVEAMLAGEPAAELPEMLAPLRSVVPFSARHGCARLPWVALREAMGG